MTPLSKHFGATQIRGLNKVGDCLLPGRDDLVSFSQLGCARHADRILDYMSAGDLADLKMLLTLLSFFPGFLVGWLMGFLELSSNWGTPIGAFLRFMRLGLRGLIMTLYYCDPQTNKIIGYDAKVYTADFKPAPVVQASVARSPGATT